MKVLTNIENDSLYNRFLKKLHFNVSSIYLFKTCTNTTRPNIYGENVDTYAVQKTNDVIRTKLKSISACIE